MAGRTLMFTVTVLSLRDATEEEVQTGVVGGLAAMGGGCCGGGGHSHSHGGGSWKVEQVMIKDMDILSVDVVVTNLFNYKLF